MLHPLRQLVIIKVEPFKEH